MQVIVHRSHLYLQEKDADNASASGLPHIEPGVALIRSHVVSPVLDAIDWKTFQYYHSVDPQRGVFDWKIDFHWEPVPKYEKKQHGSLVSPASQHSR
ncbi:Polypeptide N-acetylgalactosaminyltransferase 15 [Acipenser ruthenus]|uniref:Polypeptide N-acetylgalactosaminyltransferase 15 n=1 Tax=Acipenser ruthenus TaxID=7906 RepID=A0A444U0L5_ACIRT|nr:Polypeptide N-acetylgalactosaminyltransferase 15 [Acipenser ruthenus]